MPPLFSALRDKHWVSATELEDQLYLAFLAMAKRGATCNKGAPSLQYAMPVVRA